ncbi:MAG: hypothetical protein QOJ81_221 [Chloroflexota bacterium]|jgi:hypothetical protein|nr:hypothetical protein [Chloroflexota bacterium]
MASVDEGPQDDESIGDDSYVLRVVHPSQMAMDGNALRVTSNAFQNLTDRETGKTAVSVFEETRLHELGAAARDLIAGFEGFGVVAITVALLRGLGLGVTWEPNDLSFGAAHVHINGDKSRPIRRLIAAGCEYREWPADGQVPGL